jgi:hypothetical protein
VSGKALFIGLLVLVALLYVASLWMGSRHGEGDGSKPDEFAPPAWLPAPQLRGPTVGLKQDRIVLKDRAYKETLPPSEEPFRTLKLKLVSGGPVRVIYEPPDDAFGDEKPEPAQLPREKVRQGEDPSEISVVVLKQGGLVELSVSAGREAVVQVIR